MYVCYVRPDTVRKCTQHHQAMRRQCSDIPDKKVQSSLLRETRASCANASLRFFCACVCANCFEMLICCDVDVDVDASHMFAMFLRNEIEIIV